MMRLTCIAVCLLTLPVFGQLTFTNTTSSRAINTIYHNTSSHPILVLMTPVNSNTGTPSDTDAQLLVDSVTPPVQQAARNRVVQNFGGAANGNLVFAIVPAGYYYEVLFTFNNAPASIAAASETSIDISTGGVQTAPVRALTTVYQNTTTGVLWVEVAVTTSIGLAHMNFISDASATPTTVLANEDNDAGRSMTLMIPVLPGKYYEVTGTNITLSSWVETTTPGVVLTETDVTASRCEDGANYTVCNYTAGTALFAAITSNEGAFSSAGTHYSGNAATLAGIVDIAALTRNSPGSSGQPSENFIGVPNGWAYGDRNDDAGSTLAHWIEYAISAVPAQTRNHAYVF
jgi:hypothetical protein